VFTSPSGTTSPTPLCQALLRATLTIYGLVSMTNGQNGGEASLDGGERERERERGVRERMGGERREEEERRLVE